jgi:hypothetical protein
MYVYSIAEQRQIDIDSLDGYKQTMLRQMSLLSPEQQLQWTMKQVYIMS